jgi:hypothetical protein
MSVDTMSLWRRLLRHARSCTFTYQERITIRGRRDSSGYWRYAAYLPSGQRVSGDYHLDGKR